MMLCLAGCNSGIAATTPALDTEFNLSAVYKAGDFSYSCNIVKSAESLSVTPTSTNAAGMVISFDGREITFNKDGMVKSFERGTIDSTNPAVVLYEVFSNLESAENKVPSEKRELFVYSGKTSLGNFTLSQNEDGTLNTIEIPDADISVIF